jgi:glycosyltransferase involved in cell wall biosynthesis
MAFQPWYSCRLVPVGQAKIPVKSTVSVIIPAFNHAAFLPSCIKSIASQSDGDIEIIVVDDGSTDNTEEVVNDFHYVKYIRQSNLGPSAARNRGLEIATGSYVAFLDADDIWLDGFTSTMIPALDKCDETTALVACGWQFISTLGEKMGGGILPKENHFNWSKAILGNPLTVSSGLCRLECILEVGGFDPAIKGVEDWFLWLKLLNAGYQFLSVDRVLVGYRIVSSGISHNIQGMLENSMRLLDKAYAELNPPREILDMRAQTTAYRYLDASAGFYQNLVDTQAEHFFQQGVAVWPEILMDPHTIFTLVCARQPRGYKLSAEYLNVEEAHGRVKRLLLKYDKRYPQYVKRGMGNLYMVLARMARVQMNYRMARKYASLGLIADPRQQGMNFLRTWVKTLRSG